MWLFIVALLILVIYNYRGYIKRASANLKSRGIEIDMKHFETSYPTYYNKIKKYLDIFNKTYQKSFDYDRVGSALIIKLFSIRDDILYNVSEIKMRLPNDLNMEKEIARMYDDIDRKLMEYITDVKARFHVNINPGPISSAFEARSYRASNDIVS
jgi:uncharacterized Fe-S radical SAM superfamily protein PflX